MANIINLTPHAINLIDTDGNVHVIPASGIVARAVQKTVEAGNLDTIRLVRTAFGAPIDLPDPEEGVYYIVSAILVSSARAAGRTVADLLLLADTVRDEQGRIVGCKALALVD